MRIIVDAGPLIALSKIGQLELLPKLYREVVVPEQVVREVAGPGETRPGAEIASVAWIRATPVEADAVHTLQEAHDLDEGEAACLALAQRTARNTWVLMDERRGVRAAVALGLGVTRTGAVLVAGFEAGLLSAEAVVRALGHLRAEHYLSERGEEDILADLRAAQRRKR